MTYALWAFLSTAQAFQAEVGRYENAIVAPLPQKIARLPITSTLTEQITRETSAKKQDVIKPFYDLTLPITKFAISHYAIVAYVEAEYFGGIGLQATQVWQNRQDVLPRYKAGTERGEPDMIFDPPFREYAHQHHIAASGRKGKQRTG